MKKIITGKCKICGKEGKLSFEHVPPKAAFNRKSVKLIDGTDAMQTLTDPNRAPWDLDGLNFTIQQKGMGDYYLCEKCNNSSGSWYVEKYLQFLYGFVDMNGCHMFKTNDMIKCKVKEIYPLAIFKQVMTMFCNINNLCDADPVLRTFLLDKECMVLDDKKYRVFMYFYNKGFNRVKPITAIQNTDGTSRILSEIVSPPLGFILYIDLSQEIQISECEITEFSKFAFSEKTNFDIILPIRECNTILPSDFRTKAEMMNKD